MSDPTDPTYPSAPPPGSQPPPQFTTPPPYPQQGYAPPVRNQAQTLGLVASIVIIGGCVAAGAGVLAGFLAFATDEYSTAIKFQEFLYAVATGVGLGSIAVGIGYLLRSRA